MARPKTTGEVLKESSVDLATIASRTGRRRRRRHRLREQKTPLSPVSKDTERVGEQSERQPPPTPILRPVAGGLEIPSLSLPDPVVLTYPRVIEEEPGVESTSNDSGDSSEAETIIFLPRSAPKTPVKSIDTTKMKSASASSVSSGQSAKPLTYTTVGSVVNSDETPTFAPPVRIHREGANRRPSGSLGQNRNAFDSHSSRIHSQNFRSNYTHQQSFVEHGYFHDTTTSAYSSLNSKVSLAGTDPTNSSLTQDEQAVTQNQGASIPHQRNIDSRGWSRPSLTSGSFSPLSNITNNKKQDPAQSISSPEMGIRDQARGGFQRGIPAPPTGIAGLNPLNKMQSLQRLAQYPNPMQDMAKNRLAEFSVSRSQLSNSQPLNNENTSPRGLPPLVHNVPPRGKDINIGKNLIMALERYDPKGELEMNYRFPNPLPTQTPTTYPNDTFGDSNSTLSPPMTSSTTQDQQTTFPTLTRSYPQTQQGYPKALTAGPPGQRFANYNNNDVILQYNQGRPARPNSGASRQALVSLQDIVESHVKKEGERNKELDDDELMKQLRKHRIKELSDDEILEQLRKFLPETPTAAAFKNPWNDAPGSPRPFTNNGAQPKIYDTSTPADIIKYYKGSLPSDYNYEKPPSPIFPSFAATFNSALLHPQHTAQQATVPANPWNKPNPATLSTSHQNWCGSVGQPASDQTTSGQTGTTNPSDGWWYSGLRRIGMTAEEHVQEFENKKWRFENGYPEPTPLPGTATDHKPATMDQINQMDIPEMMEHLLNPAFGTMLALADPNPNPAASFNRFRPTEDHHRDTTVGGNKSLFGEDWGVTPGQARHQQHMETIEKAKEASESFLVNNPPKPIVPDWKIQAAQGRKEGRQLWKKHQSIDPKWIGPHGFAQERGLDRGFDLAGMVDFEKGGIMKEPIFPPIRSNKKPAQKVGTAIVPPTIKKNDEAADNLGTSVTTQAQSSEKSAINKSTKTTDSSNR